MSSIQKKISSRRLVGFCKVVFAVDCKERSPHYYWKQFRTISRDHKNIILRWHILSQFCTLCISKLRNTCFKRIREVSIAADKSGSELSWSVCTYHPSLPRMYRSLYISTKKGKIAAPDGQVCSFFSVTAVMTISSGGVGGEGLVLWGGQRL